MKDDIAKWGAVIEKAGIRRSEEPARRQRRESNVLHLDASRFTILGATVWVGGMFAAYMCLRPAAGPLEPPVRLKLWSAFFQKFLPWVWVAILLLLASGYWMMFDDLSAASPGCRCTST